MKYLMGIDNGGTMTKAAIYTTDGREVAVAAMPTDMITETVDFVERDMEQMWQANCHVIRESMRKGNVRPEEILGVGICGHGKGLYLWGKDERPVRNGIISTDNRAYAYPCKWQEDGTAAKVFERTCQQILPSQPVSLLAWLKDNEPETLENVKWVFEAKDYIRYRMTGVANGELTDFSGANVVNLHTREYDGEILKAFGLEELQDKLPPLRNATEICARVSKQGEAECGLKEGTPVIGGMFDIDACMLAVGVLDEEDVCMIAGSWGINLYLRREPVLDGSIMMNSISALPEYYLIEDSSPASASNLSWFIRTFLSAETEKCKQEGGNIYDVINDWVESLPPETMCPIYMPFLFGTHAHPNAKACFMGAGSHHTRAHFVRGLYEGVTFAHKYHFERLMHSRIQPPRAIRMAGGAVHSKVWAQMFADVMDYPVETVDANETGTLGCVIAVAAALGLYPDLKEAAKQMSRVLDVYQPNPANREIYDEKFGLYMASVQAMDGVWDQFQQAMQRKLK